MQRMLEPEFSRVFPAQSLVAPPRQNTPFKGNMEVNLPIRNASQPTIKGVSRTLPGKIPQLAVVRQDHTSSASPSV